MSYGYAETLDKWISDEKHILSSHAGFDIGTPPVVDRIISLAQQGRKMRDSNPSMSFPGNELLGWLSGFPLSGTRETIIWNYLNHAERLDGELKRYGARKLGINPSDIVVNENLMGDYCAHHSLTSQFLSNIKSAH